MRRDTEPCPAIHVIADSQDEQNGRSPPRPSAGGPHPKTEGESRRENRRELGSFARPQKRRSLRCARADGFRCSDGRSLADVMEEVERSEQIAALYMLIDMYILRTFRSPGSGAAPGLINTRHGKRPPDPEVLRMVSAEIFERYSAASRRALELYDPEQLAVLDEMNGDDDDDFEEPQTTAETRIATGRRAGS